MKINSILLFIIIILLSFNGQAQSNSINLMKYWYYRDRLKYFVVPGSGPGESQVAVTRNFTLDNIRKNHTLTYGQDCLDGYGPYLGVLATEYYLLNHNNQDYSETLMELYYALMAYDDKMDDCETKPPWNKGSGYNVHNT